MEMDHRKIEDMVPRRFHKWMKVFGKVESERMPVRKVWDHAIDLREEFVPSKARVYPLSRNEREEVQCHKPLLSPSILSLFFSFSFTLCSIYSVGKSVMLCDIRCDGVTSHVTHSLVGSAG